MQLLSASQTEPDNSICEKINAYLDTSEDFMRARREGRSGSSTTRSSIRSLISSLLIPSSCAAKPCYIESTLHHENWAYTNPTHHRIFNRTWTSGVTQSRSDVRS